MLEERLTNAYPHHSLGHGAVPGAAQYPNIQPGFPTHAPNANAGAENFYYGTQMDSSRPPPAMYASQQISGNGSQGPVGAYPPHTPHAAPINESHSHTWGATPYPSLGSPSPSNAIPNHYNTAPTPSAPAQYYTGPHDPDSARSPGPEPSYQPSPVMRRDSQYQASAPPSGPTPVPEQSASAGYVQSPGYAAPPAAPTIQQQATSPSQSYYYQSQSQPQQPNAVPSGYPSMNPEQPETYAPGTSSQPPYQQPPRPVEENLIEL